MSKTKWVVYVNYNYGWVPVDWAPWFDTKEEADAWLADDHDWDGRVEAFEEEIEEEDN